MCTLYVVHCILSEMLNSIEKLADSAKIDQNAIPNIMGADDPTRIWQRIPLIISWYWVPLLMTPMSDICAVPELMRYRIYYQDIVRRRHIFTVVIYVCICYLGLSQRLYIANIYMLRYNKISIVINRYYYINSY